MVKKARSLRQKARYSLFVLLLCFIATGVLAQDVAFNATVDKNSISIDDTVQLTLTVSGSQDVGTPELPSLEGFEIVSQGSSSQFSFINGVMSVSKGFTYILMPTKEGSITIGPATVQAEGEIYKTESLTIEVLPKGKAPRPSPKKPIPPPEEEAPVSAPKGPSEPKELKDRIFIEVTTDKEEVYLGEQITMTFKLYHRGVMIDNLHFTPPVTKGFVTESMGQQREYRDTAGGALYDVIELKTAIFPASSGVLTIEPAKLKCDLLVRQYQRSPTRRSGFFDDFFDDSFFTPYSRYPLDLESDPVTVTVKPLPADGKPSSFKGAVGTYDLQVEASPREVKAGEPINIVMEVSGAGNIGAVPEPAITNLEGFKAYESEVKTIITGRDPEIAGEKNFQKIIIPQSKKIEEIPVINLCYFDPQRGKYKTITKGPIPITVLPAPEKKEEIVELIKDLTPEEESQKAIKLMARDIQYIKTNPGRLFKIGVIWYRNLFLWIVLLVLPIILFILSFSYHRRQTKLKEDTAYAKEKSAYKSVAQTLKEAATFEKQNKPKEFYDALARAIQRYISDKLNLPPGTPGAVSIDSLVSKKISTDITEKIKSLLNTCDLARFGATTFSASDMKEALKEASHFIKILEKKL